MRRIILGVLTLVVILTVQPLAGWASWTVGRTGPGSAAASQVNRPAAPSVTKVGATARIDWTQTTLAQGTPVISYTVRRYVGATTTTICTISEPTRTCVDSSPVAGTAAYGVTAAYQLWNSTESIRTSFNNDTTAPVTTLASSPVPNGAGWNSSAPTLTLTATDAGTGVASITYKVGAAAPVTVNAASTSFTVSAAGSTTVTYSATDVAGNGESAKTYTVKLDSSAPATTLASSPVPNGAGWNSSAPTLTLTATDAGSGVASITYKIGAAAPVTVVGASTSFAVSAQGSTTVTYAATDAAGNVETTKTYTVKLDTLAPAAPTGVAISADTGSSSTDGVTKTAVQTLSGTAEANSTVELKLGAVVQGTTTASGTGAFAFSLGTLAEGSYGYTVTAIDAAGNRSTGTSYTVRVDTRAAVLSGVFPVNGGIYSNGQFKNGCATQDSVCGTVTDPAYTAGLGTVNLKLTNSAGNCLSAGGTFTSAACSTPLVPTGTTTWNYVVGTLATGTYTLTVTVTDLAGNILVGTYAFIRS